MSQQTGRGRRAFTVRRHVVQFSGGIGSFAVAVWVARKYGTRNLTLLIADTGSTICGGSPTTPAGFSVCR
ncbi:hypothetical protein [Streptomyces sp. NPDC058272]|uniref:hypothetical protein n=1 Tax=Streptomyces sp. NPDC058272 TaxID=3346415 RepID=UPI0036E9629A